MIESIERSHQTRVLLDGGLDTYLGYFLKWSIVFSNMMCGIFKEGRRIPALPSKPQSTILRGSGDLPISS